MTLIDSSIWIGHLRASDEILADLIERGQILTHPFVIGEIALGAIRNRDVVLEELEKLPSVPIADHAEVMSLIEGYRLYGRGVGYVDAHLLAAVRVWRGATLWTRDRRLLAVAEEMRIAVRLTH